MNSTLAGYLEWEHRLVAPCKGIQDNPGFWIPRRGSPIPIVSGIPDILELHSGFQSPGSEFHKQNFQDSRYHQQKYFRDTGFGFSCIARALGSWQIRLLPPLPRGGGGAYSWEFLVRVCRPVLQILTLFQTKKCNFPYPFSDLALRQKLCYNYID